MFCNHILKLQPLHMQKRESVNSFIANMIPQKSGLEVLWSINQTGRVEHVGAKNVDYRQK